MTRYLLAIDQGTTSSRAILFRPDLSVAGVAQQEFAQHYPAPGQVEHDPEDIWRTTLAAMSPTSARQRSSGSAPRADPSTTPSSGRTVARRMSAPD
jgi:glycerol kinase